MNRFSLENGDWTDIEGVDVNTVDMVAYSDQVYTIIRSPFGREVQRYDPDTDEWIILANMHVEQLYYRSVIMNGALTVFGAPEGLYEIYDEQNDEWTMVCLASVAVNRYYYYYSLIDICLQLDHT